MERRDFFKILSATSAGALGASCGTSPAKLLPLLIPDHEIVPGEEQWHPAVCNGCGAGCGTLIRVMEGVRVIQDKGEQVRERVATIKKIEGNPLDPISGGHLCARGQAAVQGLYHPDRLRGPMKRSSERGSGQFAAVPWDDAIASAADALKKVLAEAPAKVVFLTGAGIGLRSVTIDRFLTAMKAPARVVCSITDHAIERTAADLVFGWKGLPVYDLANARFALGVGADFLGGWASPVYYSRQYGAFRQGRRGLRGRFVQAESRLSLTAAAADRWLPLRPGTEPQFLTAVGRLLIDGNYARNLKDVPKPIADLFAAADATSLLAACGLAENRVREAVKDLGESEAPLVIAGASIVQANSLDGVIVSHYLNVILGNIGKPGGVLAPGTSPIAAGKAEGQGVENTEGNNRVAEALAGARMILIDGANPAYTLPRSSGVLDALKRAESVIHFGSFLDDSAAWADLILPDHNLLETETALVPAVSPIPAVAAASPFIRPLYDTRAVEKTLFDIAAKAELAYKLVGVKDIIEPLAVSDLAAGGILRQGGFWGEAKAAPAPRIAVQPFVTAPTPAPANDAQYPLEFQPYLSVQYHDGSASHLPWMQELPDPVSSSIWGLPVEIDTKTAAGLRIADGDMVRVESPHGSIVAPAYVHPGAIPGVISMAIGDGHTHFGRYASARGANPLSILAASFEKTTGALVLGGTRVKLSRVGDRKDWIQFSAPDREERDDRR